MGVLIYLARLPLLSAAVFYANPFKHYDCMPLVVFTIHCHRRVLPGMSAKRAFCDGLGLSFDGMRAIDDLRAEYAGEF